jgi:D-arabinose 1-dehydrogenase-like Zn-dependent alcohol dehydrogenase
VRARWIEEWGGALLDGERPRPVPGAGEALVRVEACSIGLTVLNCIRGDLGADDANLPRVPGHEIVGELAAVGSGVDPARVGERVMAYFYLCCGACRRCLEGPESLCERLAGVIGVDRDGGYAEYAALPARNLLGLPAGVRAADATAIPDAVATPVHVAGRARIRPGDRVAVTAAGGGVGVHMVQVARLWGADVAGLEVVPEKLRFLEEELSIRVVRSTEFEAVELPAEWEGKADVVVDLLGTRASLSWAAGALAPGGRLVVLTTFRDVDFTVSPRDLVFVQATIIGSRYASRAELLTASRLVASGRVRPVVTRVVGADGIDAVHDALRRGELVGRGAVEWSAA